MDQELKAARNATIGSQAVDARPSELGRLNNAVQEGADLLNMLHDRLQSVSHNVPTEQTSKDFDRSSHVTAIADQAQRNNDTIRYILETLAI